MQRTTARWGSFIFFCIAPGCVVGFFPWWISSWRPSGSWSHLLPLRILGAVTIVAGLSLLLHSFWRFIDEGVGTPAPVAPTTYLVVGGVYRYVRNPMYLAINSTILGEAMLLMKLSLIYYGILIAALQAAFVYVHEEPGLRQRFGPAYDNYRKHVPAWWPRLRPWTDPGDSGAEA